MGLKVFDYYLDYDFGWDLDFIVGQFNKFNLIEGSVHTTEYLDWEPNVSVTISVFNSSVFAFQLDIWIFRMSLSFIRYRAAMDLKCLR
jgi:hypothetical protein